MSDNEHDDNLELDDVVLDDDALELAAGGLKTIPTDGSGGSGYNLNQTIYFQ